MSNFTFYMSNDMGNGHQKMTIGNTMLPVLPSIIAVQRDTDLKDGIKPRTHDELKAAVLNILDTLDVSVSSPSVRMTSRFLPGKSAYQLPQSLRGFDVNDLAGKSTQDLPILLTLSTLAGHALIQDFMKTQQLPMDLYVDVSMATSLPINETKDKHSQDAYRARFMTPQPHKVMIHNFFNQIVTVHITFKEVIIVPEGEAAQYAIEFADEALKQAMKADFDKAYPHLSREVTIDDLITVEDVLGIDLGEGTSDLPVFIGGEFNPHLSKSLNVGYGNALEESVQLLRSMQMNINSRSELQAFLARPVTSLNRTKYNKVKDVVDAQLEGFADKLIDGISQVLRDVSTSISLITVYGGASASMESYLRQKLQDKTKAFTGTDDGIYIVFIPVSHAQRMNDLGLGVIVNSVLVPEGVAHE